MNKAMIYIINCLNSPSGEHIWSWDSRHRISYCLLCGARKD